MPKTIKEKFLIQGTESEKPIVCDLIKPIEYHDNNLIIFCHGYKGFKDWGCWNLMGEKFAQSGINFLKFNFSHNGGTINNPIDFPDLKAFSENNYSIEVNDVIRVINYVKSQFTYFTKAKIHLLGHSRGGGIACIASSRGLNVESLILLASVSDYKNRFAIVTSLNVGTFFIGLLMISLKLSAVLKMVFKSLVFRSLIEIRWFTLKSFIFIRGIK